MKTADIKASSTYMTRRNMHGIEYPAIVLEARNWTEKDHQSLGEKKTRVLRRSEKGSRPGYGRNRLSFQKTGIPVLRLTSGEWNFREDADDETRIIDSPHDLLVEALKQHNAFAMVDTERDVFSQGQGYRRVSVEARYADGETRTVTAEFDLVRPQDIHQKWNEWAEEARQHRVRMAELETKQSENFQKAQEQSRDLTVRVDALLGRAEHYNHSGERYDLRRKNDTGSTYEVGYELLINLLAAAERSSTA